MGMDVATTDDVFVEIGKLKGKLEERQVSLEDLRKQNTKLVNRVIKAETLLGIITHSDFCRCAACQERRDA